MTKTLLRIDASIRHNGSYSRDLGDYFEQRRLEQYPGAVVLRRDLNRDPAPHLNGPLAQAYFAGDRSQAVLQHSNQLCDELRSCTDLLLTCPMYNFGIPSTLKTYLDHVVRIQETFERNADGSYKGLLKDKNVWLLTTRGGSKAYAPFDAFESYLRGILAFMGMTQPGIVAMENTQQEGFAAGWPLLYREQVDSLLATVAPAAV